MSDDRSPPGGGTPKGLNSFAEFWPYYLREHTLPLTRTLHFVGTGLGIALLIVAVITRIWWLAPVAVMSGYLFAWIGHMAVERNRPATFTYPAWSLIGDLHMFALWLRGGLEPELRRAGVTGATDGRA